MSNYERLDLICVVLLFRRETVVLNTLHSDLLCHSTCVWRAFVGGGERGMLCSELLLTSYAITDLIYVIRGVHSSPGKNVTVHNQASKTRK